MPKSSERKKSSALLAVCFATVLLFTSVADAGESPHGVSDIRSVFVNLTHPYLSFLDDVFHFLEDSTIITESCREKTKHLIDLARGGNNDALKIFDACGKPSSSVLGGGVYFIGSYSECVDTVVVSDAENLSGKYCLITLDAKPSSHQQILPKASWFVLTHTTKPSTVGICIPQACSDTDLGNAASAMATICDVVTERNTWRDKARMVNKSSSTTELCQEDSNFDEPSLWLRLLLSFSLKTNLGKILHTTKGDNIAVLHGLRFLSMALIILGHSFSFATQSLFLRNPLAASEVSKNFVTQIFANGTLAVDTFYLISGLLVSYASLKTMEKLHGKLPLLYFYLHRYFRLSPLLGAVILFCAYLLRYVSSGPNWLSTIQMYDEWCQENGWLNLLYLQNFIHTEKMCLSHSWYLATDMQMYLVAPLILIPLYRNLKYGMMSMMAFFLTTIVITAVITAVNHYPAIPYMNSLVPLDVMNNYYKNVYIKPYCRIGPFVVGIAVGYFLLHRKELIMKKSILVMLWCLNIVLGLSVIYLMWPANQGILPTNAQAAAYSSLARSVWGICLGWLVIACFYGYGGFINSLLSWWPLVPLSRLTYAAYLIHPVVMNTYYGSLEAAVALSTGTLIYIFIGNLCITYTISIFLSALFESPFIHIEKVIMSRGNKQTTGEATSEN